MFVQHLHIYTAIYDLCLVWLHFRTRKSDTKRKYEILATGGGPPPPEENDPIAERVHAIVPTINLEIENNFDSVAVFKKNPCSVFGPIEVKQKSQKQSKVLFLGVAKKEDNKPKKKVETIVLRDHNYEGGELTEDDVEGKQ